MSKIPPYREPSFHEIKLPDRKIRESIGKITDAAKRMSSESPYLERLRPPVNAKEITNLAIAYKEGPSFKAALKTAWSSTKMYAWSRRREVKDIQKAVKLSRGKIENEHDMIKNTIHDISENRGDPRQLRESLQRQIKNLNTLAKNLGQIIEAGMAVPENSKDTPMVRLDRDFIPELEEWEKLLDTIINDEKFQKYIQEPTNDPTILLNVEAAVDHGMRILSEFLGGPGI